ncbi:MAG: cupin domain-containing protein [Emticicia sp.]|nr:cupin domain-containing protein [Emticicia sp.]
MTINDINEYFNENNLRYPEILLFSKGDRLGSENYTLSEPKSHNLIDKQKLWNHFELGYTIKIENAHLAFLQIENLCKNLGKSLKANLRANMYITPPNSHAFNPHYDLHDVIVLQLHGTKKWKLYDLAYEKPIDGQILTKGQLAHYKDIEPTKLHTINTGEIIYIPRGYVHDAYTESEMSVHITLGVYPKIKLNILKDIVQNGDKNITLRGSITTDYSKESLKNELMNSLSELIDDYFSQNPFIENYPNRLDFKNRFITFEKSNSICEHTTIYINHNDYIGIYKCVDSRIEVRTGAKSIYFPNFVESTLHSIFNEKSLKIDKIEGGLNFESRKNLVQRLLKEGLLYLK